METGINIDLEKFQRFKDNAIDKCKKLSFSQKAEGIWSDPEIVKYFTKIEPEESVNNLVLHIKDLNLTKNKILCIGGGTGSIGRRIIELFPNIHVTEIDTSEEMVSMANKIAKERNISEHFKSIKADAKQLHFEDNTYDYVIAYGVFRYIDEIDQDRIISEISRVSDSNYVIAESILGDLIYSLRDKITTGKSEVIETKINMNRVSLFYMLFKEYKENEELREMANGLTTENVDYIDILRAIAGVSEGTLYELRVNK